MEWKALYQDLGKFAATGILSIASSIAYTTWATSPSRNLTIVPQTVGYLEQCIVEHKQFETELAKLPPTPTANQGEAAFGLQNQLDGDQAYEFALRRLGTYPNRSRKSPWRVFKADWDDVYLEQLKKNDIINCAPTVAGKRVYDRTTIVKVDAVAFFDTPGLYAVDPQCTFEVITTSKKYSIPMNVIDGNTSVSIGAASSSKFTLPLKRRPLILQNSQVLSLQFDPESSDVEASSAGIATIIDSIERQTPYDARLLCSVILESGSIPVGGKRYPFIGSAAHALESRSAVLRIWDWTANAFAAPGQVRRGSIE